MAATVAAHGCSISVGLTQGYSAVLLPQLVSPHSSYNITSEESSWIAGIGVLSNPIGSFVAGTLVEIIGRKLTVLATSLPFIIGWLITAISWNISMLYVGRAISGLAVGMTTASYLYVAEISSKRNRAALSAFGPILVSLGVLAVYTLGFVLSWQMVATVCTVFSIVNAFIMMPVPESPTWLISKNKLDKSKASLQWLRQEENTAEAEFKELVNNQTWSQNKTNIDTKNNGCKIINNLCENYENIQSPTVYKPFVILLFFFLFQEGSGIYILLFYAVQVFQQFGTNYDENLVSISVGILRLAMAIIGAYLMSKVSRRTLGIFSGLGMGFSMLFASFYEWWYQNLSAGSRELNFLPILCVLFHVGFSMIGFLQLPWILSSELFPSKNRGFYCGLVTFIAYIFIFISVKIYPGLLELLSIHEILLGFCVMSISGSLFIYLFLPETRNKTLDEISRQFLDSSGKKAKSTKIFKTYVLNMILQQDKERVQSVRKNIEVGKDTLKHENEI